MDENQEAETEPSDSYVEGVRVRGLVADQTDGAIERARPKTRSVRDSIRPRGRCARRDESTVSVLKFVYLSRVRI